MPGGMGMCMSSAGDGRGRILEHWQAWTAWAYCPFGTRLAGLERAWQRLKEFTVHQWPKLLPGDAISPLLLGMRHAASR